MRCPKKVVAILGVRIGLGRPENITVLGFDSNIRKIFLYKHEERGQKDESLPVLISLHGWIVFPDISELY